MALTAPSAVLTGSTIASSFDQLLFLDAASGLAEATLGVVSTEVGKSALQISDEHVLIKGVDTSNAAVFAVQQTGGGNLITIAADTPAVTVGVDDTGADVRVYSATASEGLLYDASEDELGLLLTTKLKFHDIGGGEEIYASGDGVLVMNSGTSLTVTTPDMTLTSATASKPILHITNTHDLTTSGELRFNKDSTGDDNDIMGLISFYGTDSSDNTHERLAYMDAIITDSAHGSEAASLRFYVAENDATLTQGLSLAGQADADGEVDVTIGAGSGSTTTVAGNLSVTGTGLGWIKLQSTTASDDANVDMETSIGSTYDAYMITGSNVFFASDDVALYCRLKIGGSYKSGASDYGWNMTRRIQSDAYDGNVDIADSEIQMSHGVGGAGATGEMMDFVLYFYEPDGTDNNKSIWWHGAWTRADGEPTAGEGNGQYIGSGRQAALTGVQFLVESGNLTSGVFTLYGLAK